MKAFLLPLTLGYTITGTDDDVKKICQIMTDFRKKHNDVDFFIWIDAAFSGISKIFFRKKLSTIQQSQYSVNYYRFP